MTRPALLLAFLLCTCVRAPQLFAQLPDRPTSGEVYNQIEKLGVLGSVLYLAAHPDDENTRLIAYFANVEKVETAYLSLTRGDGGQNLIAPDIRELLGLTRTQELLAARRIDGGQQFFSRANDFGYSKHPDETFTIWDREQVLADAVWAIRKWRPDVIVLRFDPRAPGTTHGHHTASAIIGMEAFDLAGDPRAFQEQLKYVEPWQPSRIYWNAYTWRGAPKPEHMDTSKTIKLDANPYLPVLGESISEIAARSRSQHKSQGFGSAGSRNENIEQLELLGGDEGHTEGDPLHGLDLGWSRVPGGVSIGQKIAQIRADYDFSDPAASVPALLELHGMIGQLRDSGARYWRDKKLAELEDVIAGAMGLYIAARTDEAYLTPGDSLKLELEVTNRSSQPVGVVGAHLDVQGQRVAIGAKDTTLLRSQRYEDEFAVVLPPDVTTSGPYWLQQQASLGMYRVDDQQRIGLGESADPIQAVVDLRVGGVPLQYRRPVRQSFTDPVRGEQQQPLEIMPPVFAELSESSYLFTTSEPTDIQVKVTAGRAGVTGTVELCTPEGWTVAPARTDVQLERKGQEAYYTFQLTPPAGQAQGMIVPLVRLPGQEEGYTRKLVRIDHEHIPTQLANLDASAPVAKLDLATAGRTIGYLPGAGDAIPQALTNIGYEVTTLDDVMMSTGDLSQFDAIVVGIRAYNVLDRMPNYQPRLLDYVRQGGTLVVQYNTTRGLKLDSEKIGPYPLELSRDRVTVEEAPVKILAPDHPVLNYPNKITSADFDGWVQERGLYFPNKWSDDYTPILRSADPGEEDRDGGLLVAEYGEGHFVYTGYSFFRELPAGVPGAYRLFANLIGLGN